MRVMKELFQHAAITDGVTVRVAVNFLPEQSRVEAGKWFWVYHIRIENDSAQPVQLVTRHWRITDGRGMVSFVDGEGVVGEQPLLKPGAEPRLRQRLPAGDPAWVDGRPLHDAPRRRRAGRRGDPVLSFGLARHGAVTTRVLIGKI